MLELRPQGRVARGAKKSADSMLMLRAITEAYTAAEIKVILREAMEIAQARRSWEGIVSIIRLMADYGIGKPVQRAIHANMSAADFAASFIDDYGPETEEEGEVAE